MKFLVDRCAGRRLADGLRAGGHDVVEVRGPDPGDRALLELATKEGRVLVTIDVDFGTLVHLEGLPHTGLVRLPDVPATQRIAILNDVLARHAEDLAAGAIITVRGTRIRISRSSP